MINSDNDIHHFCTVFEFLLESLKRKLRESSIVLIPE